MKRILCLILALLFLLAPAVRADVIFEPEDSFYWEHRDECQYHDRSYYAAGPEDTVAIYRSPVSAAVAERVKNGALVWVSYIYGDENGISWGYCENYAENWSGWVPMDYLLLKYDSTAFGEEFANRITSEPGELRFDGEVYLWSYPGSEEATTIQVDLGYRPAYQQRFTDDAGRLWGHVIYFMGIRDVWICLDAPDADYTALYSDAAPQQVTHPAPKDPTQLPDIRPAGPGMTGILAAVGILAILSGGFLWITRKKK